MATYSSFDQLPIWQESRRLCKLVKEILYKGDGIKDFRFRDQIKDSAGSIMDNIAEGFERAGNNEFIQHLSIAKGSSGETRSQLYRGIDFEYFEEGEAMAIIQDYALLASGIASFMDYLGQSPYRGHKFKNR